MQTTIGLARHSACYSADSSVCAVFDSVAETLGHSFSLECLSPWFGAFSKDGQRDAARDFLSRSQVVVTTLGMDALMSLRAEMASSPPFLYVPLGELPLGGRSLRATRNAFRAGDVVAVSCTADAAIFANLFSDFGATLKVIPFSVDTDAFVPMAEGRRQELRRRLGLNPEDVVFLYAGRITPEKNLQSVLRVVESVAKEGIPVRLLVVGRIVSVPLRGFSSGNDGSLRRFVEVVSHAPGFLRGRYGLLQEVHRRALPDLMGAADIFMNMTVHHDENFGLGQVEAMACGLPVIGSDWGGLKDTILDGVTGYRVPTWLTSWGVYVDRPMAVQRCRQLATQPPLRRRMGSAARKRAVDLFSKRVVARQLQDVVAQMADHDAGASGGGAVLTNFGKEYEQAFGLQGITGDRYTRDNYHLYSRLIEPYATGRVNASVDDERIVFATSLMYDMDGSVMSIRDPLWSRKVELGGYEKMIMQELAAGDGMVKSELLARLGASGPLRSVLEQCLRWLVEQGLVCPSERTA